MLWSFHIIAVAFWSNPQYLITYTGLPSTRRCVEVYIALMQKPKMKKEGSSLVQQGGPLRIGYAVYQVKVFSFNHVSTIKFLCLDLWNKAHLVVVNLTPESQSLTKLFNMFHALFNSVNQRALLRTRRHHHCCCKSIITFKTMGDMFEWDAISVIMVKRIDMWYGFSMYVGPRKNASGFGCFATSSPRSYEYSATTVCSWSQRLFVNFCKWEACNRTIRVRWTRTCGIRA